MQTDTLSDKVLIIYCFVDDFLKKIAPKNDKQRKFTDAQVITTALIAAKKFKDNYSAALDFLSSYEGFYRIDRGVFSKRLHNLEYIMSLIFSYLGQTIKELNVSKEYIIDTFPVSVCRNIRIPTCKLFQGESYRGYNKSKREWFYGFKVQIITNAEGIPVQFDIFCGETGDITAFQSSQICLPEGSHLFGDKAYNDYEQEDLLLECDEISLKPVRKSNSKRADKPYEAFYKNHVRKMVENSFAMITDLFPRHIHATSDKGFLLKIFIFVLAFTILQ
ncbi:MAG: IS982 family transposase [Cytophagia bacterium]|nr:MAG: IS982 family transposase [Cytophagales bacterium]TAG38196.1 MAG: IS982 family transposase [Cytophagia bacterium]